MRQAVELTRAARRACPAAGSGRHGRGGCSPGRAARGGTGGGAAAVHRRRAAPLVQDLQVSLRLTLPVGGTVAVRFAPVSQVTLPAPSLRRYLYWKEVPAGRPASSFHTG